MVTYVPTLLAKIADDGDFMKLKEMASVHENWSLDYDKNDVQVWSKAVSDASIKMVKVRSIFPGVSSTDLYNTLMDPTYRREWDTHMIVGYEIGYLNPNNSVSYYAVSCPTPLRSRDFVLQTSWLDRGTEQYILNHSVCHKDFPPKRGHIRALSYFTGYFTKSVSYNGSELTFVSQTDPQGIIPAWIVNKCTQIFAPRFIKQLEKAAFSYGIWKRKNNPNFKPWVHPEQMTCPKISLADCLPCEEELQSDFYKYFLSKINKSSEVHTHTPNPPLQAVQKPCHSGSSSNEMPETDVSCREKKSKRKSLLWIILSCKGNDEND